MEDGKLNASSLKGAGIIAMLVVTFLVAGTLFGSGTFSNAPGAQTGDSASAQLVAPINDPQMTKAVQIAQRSGSTTGWSAHKSSGPKFTFEAVGGPVVLTIEEINAANANYRQLKQISNMRKGKKFTHPSSSDAFGSADSWGRE